MFNNDKSDFKYWDFPGLVRAFAWFEGFDVDFQFNFQDHIASVRWDFSAEEWLVSGSLNNLLYKWDEAMIQIAAHEIGHIVKFHFNPPLTRRLLMKVRGEEFLHTIEEREADEYASQFSLDIV